MTHFIGAVLVPPHVEFITNTERTKYPDLYGKDAKEWIVGSALNDYLNTALAKFDENVEVERWVSKADTIAEGRKAIEKYHDGTYAKYLADPVKYAEGVSNGQHLEYLRTEFPKKLEWTDEEVYADSIKLEEDENIREDGAVRHTYNPESKWDWWTIGGRWEQTYRERQGEKILAWREELQRALVNMRDPEAIAELQVVEADIARIKEQWSEQGKVTKAWYDANPVARTNSWEQNVLLAHGGTTIEKVLSWEDIDVAEAKLLDCRAYVPWWTPYSVVVPLRSSTKQDDFQWITRGNMGWFGSHTDNTTDEEWIESLLTITEQFDPESRLVYIDFHI